MKLMLIVDVDDEYLDRINVTPDELIADVTIYKKERIYINKCWYSLKPLPKKKEELKGRGKDHCEYSLLERLEYRKGFNDCLDEILGGTDE